jgi:hypothetical protein
MANDEVTVFLSYAREDSVAAGRLYKELTSAGAQVWFDQKSLLPGEKWDSATRRAIRGSKYFLAILSARAVTKKGFIQKEIREALSVLEEFPDDVVFLIPARIDDCMPSYERLNELNWVDLFPNWDSGVAKLLSFFGLTSHTTELSDQAAVDLLVNPAALVPYIRIDGLYQSRKGDSSLSYWGYFRFFADGTVLSVSSTGSPSDVARWLTMENVAEHSSGRYHVTGSAISFSSKSSEGIIDYEGEIQGNFLFVRSHSHINGYRGVYEYTFTKT